MFVDEKTLTVNAEVKHRNSHVIIYDPSDVLPVFRTKNPASLMVFGDTVSDKLSLIHISLQLV